ncbi:MAG TPA: hypothetical protein VM142_07445 [Acidimicrobiales bacterium]|nr:hypothetical protein [Acidimicrobiales bacterium]
MPHATYTRTDLTGQGFAGFVPFHQIDLTQVPTDPGVYVVLRESDLRPSFLSENPAGRFKGRNPTVPVVELEAAWPDGAHCLYIGKAAAGSRSVRHLRQRIKEFRQYGDGLPVGHQGGRRIWQLADADTFVIAWLVTPDRDPADVEGELIRQFVDECGKRPIGNRTSGRRR